MRSSLRKDLKLLALAYVITFGLLAVPSLLGTSDQGRTVSLLVELAIVLAAFFLATAAPSVLWGWDLRAGMILAMGLLVILLALIAFSGSPRDVVERPSVWLFLLVMGATFLVLAWLMRKFRDPEDRIRHRIPPAGGAPPPWNPPSWMPSSLHLVYRTSSGHPIRYEIRQRDGGWIMRFRDEEAEAMEREWGARNPEPPDAASPNGEDPWSEYPMGDWAQTDLEPLLDVSRPWESQPFNKEQVTEAGRDSATFQGTSYPCRKIRVEWTTDCVCVSMASYHMFYIGPGRCATCAGLFSRLRRCPKCKGTGRCEDCPGTGKNARETMYWFDERRGILLRSRHTSDRKAKRGEDLESLEPDVLARW